MFSNKIKFKKYLEARNERIEIIYVNKLSAKKTKNLNYFYIIILLKMFLKHLL